MEGAMCPVGSTNGTAGGKLERKEALRNLLRRHGSLVASLGCGGALGLLAGALHTRTGDGAQKVRKMVDKISKGDISRRSKLLLWALAGLLGGQLAHAAKAYLDGSQSGKDAKERGGLSTEASLNGKESFRESMCHTTMVLDPGDCSSAGIASAGFMLASIDLCAARACYKHLGRPSCTKTLDEVHFLEPAVVNEIVHVHAHITRVFAEKKSLEVLVVVTVENPLKQTVKTCCYAIMTFSILNSRRERWLPPISQVAPRTSLERQAFEDALVRETVRGQGRVNNRQFFSAAAGTTWEDSFRRDPPPPLSATVRGLPAKCTHETAVQTTQSVTPSGTPIGQVMQQMELAAGISAYRHARSPCIPASVDQMSFLNCRSLKVGDLLIISAQINRSFQTSMEVGVSVKVYSVTPDGDFLEPRHCNSAYFTYVAIGAEFKAGVDSRLRPEPVPHVVPQMPSDKKRYALAKIRRERRLEGRGHAKKFLASMRDFQGGTRDIAAMETVGASTVAGSPVASRSPSLLAGMPEDSSLIAN